MENYKMKQLKFTLFNTFFSDHPEWCSDRDMVMLAVLAEGTFLDFACDEFKNDREIVMTAVSQNGIALMCASQELRSDPEIVTAAIEQNGYAIQYSGFKHDIDYVMKALEQIDFADNWSNMYSVGDPIFQEVAERRKILGK